MTQLCIARRGAVEHSGVQGRTLKVSSLTGAGGTAEGFEQACSAVRHSAVGGGGVGGGGVGETPTQISQAHFFASSLHSSDIVNTGK